MNIFIQTLKNSSNTRRERSFA